MNKARVESFSDGVFAFVITLLVLGIPIPDLTIVNDQQLRNLSSVSLSLLSTY